MKPSSLFRYVLILQTSSLQSADRNALESHSHIEFILLCIATGIVGVGIFFEWPEVRADIREWWISKPSKRPSWMIGPPPKRNFTPVWALIGFLLVAGGVAAEGIFETLVGINDTDIRQIDKASTTADELKIAELQKANLGLQKQTGDAAAAAKTAKEDAEGAHNIAISVGLTAKNLGRQLGTEMADLAAAKTQLATAQDAVKKEEQQLHDMAVCTAPRVFPQKQLFNGTGVVKSFSDPLKPSNKFEAIIEFVPDAEARRAAVNLASAFSNAGWRVVGPFVPSNENSIPDGVTVEFFVGFKPRRPAMDLVIASGDAASNVVSFLHSYNWRATQMGFKTDEKGSVVVGPPSSIPIPPDALRIRVGLYPAVTLVSPPGDQVFRDMDKTAERQIEEFDKKWLSEMTPEVAAHVKEALERSNAEMKKELNPCMVLDESDAKP